LLDEFVDRVAPGGEPLLVHGVEEVVGEQLGALGGQGMRAVLPTRR
jgi:hypothetical protein